MRIETGAVQFGSDWPCLVIRGDNAMWYSMMMNLIEQEAKEKGIDISLWKLNGFDSFKELLSSCSAGPIDSGKTDCQFLKPFEECVKGESNE